MQGVPFRFIVEVGDPLFYVSPKGDERKEQVVEIKLNLLKDYATELVSLVWEQKRAGLGMQTIGLVAGRSPDEDTEIGIDVAAEGLLKKALVKIANSLEAAMHVFSEHGRYDIGSGPKQMLVSVDPFDGSGLFQRGIPAEWWAVWSLFLEDCTPVFGCAVDILRGVLYVAQQGEVVRIDLSSNGEETHVFRGTKNGLDDTPHLAAYLMNPTYFLPWASKMNFLGDYPKVRVWPNGGSCIYPWLAEGLVHAYVMFEEPRTEIDPGLGFAQAAGLTVASVAEDGTLVRYRFDPTNTAGRVPLFIAACTHELAEEIARKVISSN
ncbi:MAG: hypothetical protein A3E07_00620 [Candidatus Wildermuthbacteria bacterium RIFCSPHIGHO2_12_FULL_45_9]|nr:MAG: hypothetical protein A2748_00405 [Candidatus Wildermuthbacteria bacterium RIFCSPHIGHO2_01_FULL_45_20]OHA70296.1 MAG: hypothetical protein A3E07_00620 [Candidatus Wildermuthbacteria bacterium RIFCSPHIGHO2_12_FULL_45_9]